MGSDSKRVDRPRTGDANRPAYDNPVGNKGDLAAGDNALSDEAKGHPNPGQHVGKQKVAGQHGQRPDPVPHAKSPQGHDSDAKLGQKPPSDG
jgi:hypothetical protein